MGHDEISKRLSAYLDGEVGNDERAVIERHVADCGICAAILNGLREVSALVRGIQLGKIDPDYVKHLHERVDNLSRRAVERFAWSLAAFAACIALLAGIRLFVPAQDTQTAAAVPAPAAWEGAAVQLTNNSNEDIAPATNGDLAMAQWMVADLSEEGRTHE